ncbi:MAG: hypothetical protein CVT74_05045 [Alphaproteobacteria bacterium HGW-Alphaproteobacteria-13]|nr:MAG: hypothetical protein CVT74_05045 [Alphaproteobacteria bacterium HGW-Alphaproteobacteria-13]
MSRTHQYFTVKSTAYLRNLSREDIWGRQIAVHFQQAPKPTPTGTSVGMIYPVLLLSLYIENRQEIAEKVARILNAHWEDEEGNHMAAAAPDMLAALEGLMPINLGAIPAALADDETLPCDVTIGELRAARDAILKAKGGAA